MSFVFFQAQDEVFMKLRRALASVAVSAAIAPAALLTVTPAFADDAIPSASASSSADATPTPSASASATVTTSPSQSASPTPSTSTSPAPSQSATPTADPTNGTNCTVTDDPQTDDNLTTSIKGLPSKIAAGSGWHAFSLDVANSSSTDYNRVDFGVFAAESADNEWGEDTSHLKLQFQDPSSGRWNAISLDENDPNSGYLGWSEVAPHASMSIKLRLNVDSTAPAGDAYTLGLGIYADAKGDCVISGGDGFYEFHVVPAGQSSGGGDAKPTTGGQKPVPPKPSGDTPLGATADLAATGSSSSTPIVAVVGGVVLLAGAGTVVALRRRGSRTTA
jgi:LPXTG-motif cell wall-anchored protein